VVAIGKIKCPNLTEDNIREMIIQVRREGAYSKEHSSRPLKVVLKPEAREFRTMMLQRCPALQRANAEMKTIIRVQEDVTPMQAVRFQDCQSKVEQLNKDQKGKWVVVGGKGSPSIRRDRTYHANGTLKPPRTEMSKEMRQEEAVIRMVEAKRRAEMTLYMKALLTLAEKHREEIRKEIEKEQD
jgi:hypothetical protein